MPSRAVGRGCFVYSGISNVFEEAEVILSSWIRSRKGMMSRVASYRSGLNHMGERERKALGNMG